MIEKSFATSPKWKRSAVTLLEMLIAMVIIGILAGLTFLMFSHAEKTAENIEAQVHSAKSGKKKGMTRKATGPKSSENSVIVVFKPGTANPKAEAVRLAELCAGSVLYNYSGPFLGCALKIQPGTQDKISTDSVVAKVGADRVYHAHLEIIPTGIRRIYASPLINALNLNNKIHNIQGGSTANNNNYGAVAVIDSGVDNTHPDLNVVFNLGFNNPNFGDPAMHGTHVAGIIGALNNNFGVVGVAPGAPIWNLRVLDANGNGLASDVIAALIFASTQVNQVPIINMSIGAFPPPDPFVNAAIAYCVSLGQTVVVCASNESIDVINESPPSEPSAICVAALADSDGLPGGLGPVTAAGPDDTFAVFSNYGALVKFIAPGVDILSTLPGGTYGYETGTSMAAPHVSGIASRIQTSVTGKIRNIVPSGANGKYTPAQVLQIMLQNSTEFMPGIYDNRTYPVANAKGF